MMPGYIAQDHFFDYPLMFDIQIPLGANGDFGNPYMFDIAPSVLTSFSVNYQPNGPAYHDLGGLKVPMAVEIQMDFTELTITTRDNIQDQNR